MATVASASKLRAADLFELLPGSGPAKRYWDKSFFATFEEQLAAIAKSNTVYVGNLSYSTSEQHVYELARLAGPIKKVIMGLNRDTKEPCGFAFVEYFSVQSAVDAETLLSGKTLETRVLKIELDPGFREGRQFGRGRGGGQVRDDFREEDDPERGGVGSLARAGLLPNQQQNRGPLSARPLAMGDRPMSQERPAIRDGGYPPRADYPPAPIAAGNGPGDFRRRGYSPDDKHREKRTRWEEPRPIEGGSYYQQPQSVRSGYMQERPRDDGVYRNQGPPYQGDRRYSAQPQSGRPMQQRGMGNGALVDEFGRDIDPQRRT